MSAPRLRPHRGRPQRHFLAAQRSQSAVVVDLGPASTGELLESAAPEPARGHHDHVSRSSDRDRAELYGDSQDGVITLRALLDWGISSSTVSRRCRPGGPWRKLLPGIVLMSSAPPTRRQLVDAAILYAGAGALVTGLEATARHGLTKVPTGDAVHVLVPIDRRRLSREFVVIERTARLPDAVVRNGLPLAPVVRAGTRRRAAAEGP